MELIDKEKVEGILKNLWKEDDGHNSEHRICYNKALQEVQCEIDTLEVKDPYEQCVQYDSIKAGIQAHAETYSFNIESKLFNQLTKEQQELWRKEIEQALVLNLQETVVTRKIKEVDLEKEIQQHINDCLNIKFPTTDIKLIAKDVEYTARKFFELGLKAQKGE